MGSPVGLPPGFKLDEPAADTGLPPGFKLDENPSGFAAAGAADPRGAAEQMLSGALHGGGRAALSMVNPVDWARSAAAAAALGYRMLPIPGNNPSAALGEVAQGAKDIATHVATSPEAMGEVLGSTAVGIAGPGLVGRAARALGAERLLPTEMGRAHNIRRALRAPEGKSDLALKVAHDIESMAPEINLPVAVSPESLARKLTAQRAITGAAVGSAESALPATRIPVSGITSRLETPPGRTVTRVVQPPRQAGLTAPVQAPRSVTEFIPYDEASLARHRSTIGELEHVAGPANNLTAPEAVVYKREMQRVAAEKGAYNTEEAQGAAEAARAKAGAIRGALEALPGTEAEKLTAANRAHQVASTIEPLAAAEATRVRGLPIASRGGEILVGRAAASGQGGATGALAGLAGGQILDSTLFQTASAATKRRIIDALRSGQPQRARDILVRASITDVERRRLAAAALAAQGEGVTSP